VAVDLQQDDDNGRVGTRLGLTAAVTVRGEVAVQGGDVDFASTGPGPAEQRDVTDSDGEATVTMSSDDPVDAQITATVTIEGCGTVSSEPVVHQWWRPVLDLRPKGTGSPARRPVEFSATLVRIVDADES